MTHQFHNIPVGMFFRYGNSRNGKSTFINIIQDLLGDYGRQTNSDTFLKKKNDSGINNDVARLGVLVLYPRSRVRKGSSFPSHWLNK